MIGMREEVEVAISLIMVVIIFAIFIWLMVPAMDYGGWLWARSDCQIRSCSFLVLLCDGGPCVYAGYFR